MAQSTETTALLVSNPTIDEPFVSDDSNEELLITSNPTDDMEIFIQSADNRIISFNVEPEDTIKYIKSIIQEKNKVPIDKQTLYFNEQPLNDDQTLSHYDISHQSALTLLVTTSKQIFIKQNNGKSITLDVELDYSIKKVKSLLNIDSNDPKLIFNGKVLLDDKTLIDYEIKNEYTLYLMNDSPLQDPNIAIESTVESTLVESKYVSDNDPLATMLKKYNLYNDLYQVLSDNGVDWEMLENDLGSSEVEAFCQEFGLNMKQTLKFRKLMRTIEENKKSNTNINNDADINVDIASNILANIMLNEEMLQRQQSLDETKKQHKMDEYQAKKREQEFIRKQSLVIDDKMTVILVGDMGAGKTSLMRKYVQGTFAERVASSIGVDSMVNIATLSDNTNMELTIWDTAGQERFQSIGRAYYKRGECIIICYDISIEDPFKNFIEWRRQIKEHGNDDVVVILVGCKMDLAANNMERHQLNFALAQSIIEEKEWMEFNAMHCECSAKRGDNVNGVFIAAAELVLRTRKSDEEKNVMDVSLKRQLIKKETEVQQYKENVNQMQQQNVELAQEVQRLKQQQQQQQMQTINLEETQPEGKPPVSGCKC